MNQSEGLLSGYRILDLTDEKGHLCGKVLGDFGADVIKIERPGGDPARNRGPFYKDVADPEKSLHWFAFNTSKRGITLDIESHDGREIFKRLVETADLLIESFEPGHMDRLRLGYADLQKIKPDVILTSITPFGQTGPHAHYKATDLVAVAMGGLARILGDLGRAPVRMSCEPQAYCQAGVHAAVGSMVALYHRALTGQGQHVDVSMQEAVELTLMNAIEVFDLMKVNLIGMGQFLISPRPQPLGPLFLRFVVPCKDGHVVLYFTGGMRVGIHSSNELVRWANEEGMALELKDYDFHQWDGSTMLQEDYDRYIAIITAFLLTKTKEDLLEGAVKRGIMMAPCATMADIVANRQLEARGFWQEVEHPELGDVITYPGAPVRLSGTPWRMHCRAPLIGEHNDDIYTRELHLTSEEIATMKSRNII